MSRSQRARWRHAVIWCLFGASALLLLAGFDHLPLGVVAFLLALVGAWYSSPLRPDPSTSHWDAQGRHVRDGSIIIYWRPGCWTCLRLRWALRRESRDLLWVNVWADDEAAAFVRDVNGGAEVVPTAILRSGDAVTHPTYELLRADLAVPRAV